MTRTVISFKIPTHYASFAISGLAFVMLIFATLSPTSAAVVSGQPGMIKALGKPVDAITATPSPDLLLVRRGGRKGRSARRGRGKRATRARSARRRAHRRRVRSRRTHRRRVARRRVYRSRQRRYRSYRGRRFYYSIPFYAYVPTYSYRPSYGRCEYWHRRCAANWGYRNRNYYGCMRYQGCR